MSDQIKQFLDDKAPKGELEKLLSSTVLKLDFGGMRNKLEKLRDSIGGITVEGSAGGDLVRVIANGRMEVVKLMFSPDFDVEDKEFAEVLVMAAVNQALKKVRDLVSEEAAKLMGMFGGSS